MIQIAMLWRIMRGEKHLPDIAVAEIPVDEEERPLPPPEPRAKDALLDGPILRTLLSLAWPNVIALSAGTCVVIAETSYIGRLGVEALAAMALVFRSEEHTSELQSPA